MKRIHSFVTVLFLSALVTFGQSEVDWKTKKNVLFNKTGISKEGHEATFSTQIFKNKHQFLELEGGSGFFSPVTADAKTLSSGFTFNRGIKNHFISIGLHMIYASKDAIKIESYTNQEAYISKAIIGYHYSSRKLDFKVHVQPLTGILRRITDIGSSASLSFQF